MVAEQHHWQDHVQKTNKYKEPPTLDETKALLKKAIISLFVQHIEILIIGKLHTKMKVLNHETRKPSTFERGHGDSSKIGDHPP